MRGEGDAVEHAEQHSRHDEGEVQDHVPHAEPNRVPGAAKRRATARTIDYPSAIVSIRFTVNGVEREFAGDGSMPLLWYLRDHARLTGTKFGCGGGFCGACTVLVDGAAMRSCVAPVSSLAGRSITTIEGLGKDGLHAVKKAWIEEDVAQCGYCQAG